MLSIGALASAAQGASYYERDGYYAKDDPEHRAASAWAGKGAEELGLKDPVDPETFRVVLEGTVTSSPSPAGGGGGGCAEAASSRGNESSATRQSSQNGPLSQGI